MSITRDALELTGNNARIWRIVLLLSTLVLEMRGGWYKWSVIEQFTRTQCTDGSNSNSKGAPINCGKVLKLKRFNKLSEKNISQIKLAWFNIYELCNPNPKIIQPIFLTFSFRITTNLQNICSRSRYINCSGQIIWFMYGQLVSWTTLRLLWRPIDTLHDVLELAKTEVHLLNNS